MAADPLQERAVSDERGDKRRGPGPKNALQRYLQSIRDIKLLTQSGEVRLAVASRQGVEAARRELVERNLRLVVKIALSYRSSTTSLEELIAEGNLGLMEAARRFDPERRVRFVSYAAWWVRKYMVTALHRGSQHATSPTPNAGPARGAAGGPSASAARPARQRILSFEDFMHDSGDRQFIEGRASLDAPDPEETILERQLEDALASILDKLPPMERQILEWHYGIGGGPVRTLHEIGQALGYTRERVRQVELRALDRARRLLEAGRGRR